MTTLLPRVRILAPLQSSSLLPGSSAVDHERDPLIVRDLVRIVFFVPRDHFDIAVGVSHALDSYLRAVEDQRAALLNYTCCEWEPSVLSEWGWQRIHDALRPKERRYADDSAHDEEFEPLKDGADPYFGLYGAQDSGFSFEYHARVPWRESPPNAVSVLRATLPTELLEARGADFVRGLALDMASQLPFASGHAGLALDIAYPMASRLDALGPLLLRHPGFDIRDAGIRDNVGLRVDGIHWMNFLGPPVVPALGGELGLRGKLHSPDTRVQALDEGRVLVSLGAEPETGDLAHARPLPGYRELARVLEPWQEPFPWGALLRQGHEKEEALLRGWWTRFLELTPGA